MKTLFLGDTHGRTIWKDIIKKEDPDRIVFVGDYVDTHYGISGEDQLSNLKEILTFKSESDKEVILLIGNHDYHYWPYFGGYTYSGYQGRMAKEFNEFFHDNADEFQMSYGFDNIIC